MSNTASLKAEIEDSYSHRYLTLCASDVAKFDKMSISNLVDVYHAFDQCGDALVGIINRPRCLHGPHSDYIDEMLDDIANRRSALIAHLKSRTVSTKADLESYGEIRFHYVARCGAEVGEVASVFEDYFARRAALGL